MIDVVVLFFLLGVFARLVKSDLRLPEALYETLSIYLLLAIGLKGGLELSRQPLAALLPEVLVCMALGFAIPFVLYPALQRFLMQDMNEVSPLPESLQQLQTALQEDKAGNGQRQNRPHHNPYEK